MKLIPALLASLSLALFSTGCAQQSSKADETPRQPTNVLTAEYVINGFIMPDSTGSQTVYTREDRRRIDQTIEYDSWASRRLLGNGQSKSIARIDKNLVWQVDDKRKTFTECPLSGCIDRLGDPLPFEDDSEQDDYYDPSGGQGCNLRTADITFDVTPQRQSRVINGFAAQQYQAEWRLVNKDEQGRSDINSLKMDFWMTEPTADMQAGWTVNGAFQDNYLRAVRSEQNPLSRFFGDSIYKALAMFFGDIGPEHKTAVNGAVGKLAAIEGYPVSIKLQWYSQSNACPEVRQAQSESNTGIDYSDPAGALTNMATGFLKKTAKNRVKAAFTPNANEPLFTYIYDVTSAQIRDEHDSVFEIPAGYKVQDRK